MKVNVLFFASLKEDLGVSEIELDVSELAGRSALFDSLTIELGSDCVAPLLAENISIAVNRNIEKGEFVLKPGDEIAFLPPITGG
ncbi:MAG: MoaD/ThiS family protein [Gammaproteobacteria bacterium]|nr:MoaD/ThiS family protein [Gammaproteobacteria bacterium]